MITITLRRFLFALSLSVPIMMPANVLAGEYESWINADNAEKYCDVRNVNDLKSANAFQNKAQIEQISLSKGSISQQQVQASNSGWATQSIGSIEQRSCAALIHADTQRYIFNGQLKNQRYIYDTNIRQQLLGNMLRW